MTPAVNNHDYAEPGCWAAGHRGWYIGDRVIEIAEGFGYELDAEGQAVRERYYAGESDPESDDFEIVVGQGGIVDEAEQWLNDHTDGCRKSDGAHVFWHGQWYDDDGNAVPDEDVQRFVWHFSDGEFFLSPEEDLDSDG
jgi:hypothetical protein